MQSVPSVFGTGLATVDINYSDNEIYCMNRLRGPVIWGSWERMKNRQALNRINKEHRWKIFNKFELDFDTIDILIAETNSAQLNELEISEMDFLEISEILKIIKENEKFLEKL